MLSYIWPVALVVLSNTFYHICAKSAPEGMDALASLTVTYLVGAAVSAVLYYALRGKGASLIAEYRHLNWAPFVLGLVIVGLEAGCIFAYKNGWEVSVFTVVQSAFLACVLIAAGALLFREKITWNKVIGIVICLIGLYFINRK